MSLASGVAVGLGCGAFPDSAPARSGHNWRFFGENLKETMVLTTKYEGCPVICLVNPLNIGI
jgi:hypothetical protein